MFVADEKKMNVRDLISRQSTSSVESEAMFAPSCGNSMEVLHGLYQKLEPQISKSYRPNVKYVPGNESEPRHMNLASHDQTNDKTKKQKQMKTAKMVIDAVSEMQKRRDSTASTKRKFSDIARRASAQGLDESIIKGVSQSMPDLTEKAET